MNQLLGGKVCISVSTKYERVGTQFSKLQHSNKQQLFNMKGLCREVNKFFSYTSIHGFSYISDSQSRSTRITWAFIVFVGFCVTSYFLFYTIDGFNNKQVSTIIETKNIQEYPFPAVTLYPSAFNSKQAFLRDFLNEFEFSRYDDNSSMRDNGKFMNTYGWLISPVSNKLLDDTEIFMIQSNVTLLQRQSKRRKKEVCQLTALHIRNISLKRMIREEYVSNMYKNGFIILLSSKIIPIIENHIVQQNLTQAEIMSACNDAKNEDIKIRMLAMLISPIYITRESYRGNANDNQEGAGDVATGPYGPKLLYSTHVQLTNMYNDMLNSSLPVSVLEFPSFFVFPDKTFAWTNNKWKNDFDDVFTKIRNDYIKKKIDITFEIKTQILQRAFAYTGLGYSDRNVEYSNELLRFINITYESMRNYHYLWYSYIQNRNITLFCFNGGGVHCNSEPSKYLLGHKNWHNESVKRIRNDSKLGIVVDFETTSTPCTNQRIIQNLKLTSICNFIANISANKAAFLKLMKFTKQSPVYLEDHDEYISIPSKYGYNFKLNRRVAILLINLISFIVDFFR